MSKVKIGTRVFTYPMPTVLVGAMVEGKPNFMAIAWIMPTNARPPMLAVAIGPNKHTMKGIEAHGVFSVNVPSVQHVIETDYCGIVSGRKTDKSTVFRTFTGVLEHAPLIEECPLCIECRVIQKVALPTNTLCIGEVVESWCEESVLTDGIPDVGKMRPFALTMPDNRYWSVGEVVGHAWRDGLKRS